MISYDFWNNKKVLITGHTGFKGTWLSIYLSYLGAQIKGYALKPITEPSLYEESFIEQKINSTINDINNLKCLTKIVNEFNPEIVIHLAAQALVRESYIDPLSTLRSNVLGTATLLEALRNNSSVKVILNVTTDKCYSNQESFWGYRESDPLGGDDIYSASKACSEIITHAYQLSFFTNNIGIATARAGNVIGGGDWSKDRLIPDCIKSITQNKTLLIRNPYAIRPWQHVLEPLTGYLLLIENLYDRPKDFSGAWNFGPSLDECQPVHVILEMAKKFWSNFEWKTDEQMHPAESNILKLDHTKSKTLLGWKQKWSLNESIEKTILWYKCWHEGSLSQDLCVQDIRSFLA